MCRHVSTENQEMHFFHLPCKAQTDNYLIFFFPLAIGRIYLLVMPKLMTSRLPSGTPECAKAFIGLLQMLERQLSLEDVQQLTVLAKSMIEVTTIWAQLLSDNGNVLPPEWNADEDLKNVKYRCDDKLFSSLGRSLATVLTDLLQVIDLDIQNLTDVAEHLRVMLSVKENHNTSQALRKEQEIQPKDKQKMASCQKQDDIRRQSLEQLQELRERKRVVEEEERKIEAMIADIDRRQSTLSISSTTSRDPIPQVVPNGCIDSATRARIFMEEYEKRKKSAMPAQETTAQMKIGNQMCSPVQLFERCKVLKQEKDLAFSEKCKQEKKLIEETIKTNRAIALAKKSAKLLKQQVESTVAYFN